MFYSDREDQGGKRVLIPGSELPISEDYYNFAIDTFDSLAENSLKALMMFISACEEAIEEQGTYHPFLQIDVNLLSQEGLFEAVNATKMLEENSRGYLVHISLVHLASYIGSLIQKRKLEKAIIIGLLLSLKKECSILA